MNIYIYIIDQVRGQDGWKLADFSFCVFMDRGKVKVHENTKRERGQYPAILTKLAWSIKDLLHGIKSTEKMIFVLVCFRALKTKPVTCKSDNAFRFSSSILTQKSQKIFLLSWKIFCETEFSCTPLSLRGNVIAGTKRAIPSGQYHSILPTWVANHSAGFGSSCPHSELAM